MPTAKTEESCRDGLLCCRILQSVDNGLRIGIHPLWALPQSEKRRLWFRRYQQRLFLFDLRHIPGVRFRVEGITKETFGTASIIVCNHQSMLDSAVFMALSPKTILVSNSKVSRNRVIRKIYQWNGFITLDDKSAINDEL